MNFGIVAALDIDCHGGIENQVAIGKGNAAVLLGKRFQPDFQRASPPAPKHAVFHLNILYGQCAIRYDAFERDCVVERTNKLI